MLRRLKYDGLKMSYWNNSINGLEYGGSTPALGAGRLGSIPSSPTCLAASGG